MPKVERAGRSREIANEAANHRWTHVPRGPLDLAPYARFHAFRGQGDQVVVKNRVEGHHEGCAFSYFEYAEETASGFQNRAAYVCTTPFHAPGLRFAQRDGRLAVDCHEPGFVDAVLEAPVRTILAENPAVDGEWHGDRLLLRHAGTPADWNDFRGVAEALVSLMARVPEMEFEAVTARPRVAAVPEGRRARTASPAARPA